MKTSSTRIKCRDDGAKPDRVKAGTFLFLGIVAIAGSIIFMYLLISIFIVFNINDLSPYIYYSLGFAASTFLVVISFYYFRKYK